MKTTTCFSEEELNPFKSMIGKQFIKFKCDQFVYSPMVYGVVGIYIDNMSFKITSLCENEMRFFNTDDIAVFRMQPVDDSEIETFMDDGTLIDTPILSKIISIDIVNDHQSLEHEGETKTVDYSVGVIFHLEDTREISFEIKSWFSEMITIEKGYNLIEKFTPIDDFLEEWEDCDGYSAKCIREIIRIM